MAQIILKKRQAAPVCGCGCGQPVKRGVAGKYNNYLHGHNGRNQSSNSGQFKPGNKCGKGRAEGSRNKVTIAAMNIIVDPAGDMTLGHATDKFISSAVDKAHGTMGGYITAQTQLIKFFGEKCLLSAITPLRMTKFVDYRRQVDTVGASKIYQELSFVRQIYSKATTWGINIPSPELAIKRSHRQIKNGDLQSSGFCS